MALLGGGSLLSGCGIGFDGPSAGRIGPASPLVIARERALEHPYQPRVQVALHAVPGPVEVGQRVVNTWSYGGQLPGREIRVHRGDRLSARVHNSLPVPTSVHWHGIALRNDMDGVPGLTQSAIASGSAFDYEFSLPEPGTYWLHPHVGTQLDRGLYAPLIVEDPTEPAHYDQELVVVSDDWLDGTGRTPEQVLAGLQAHGMGAMTMGGSALLDGDAGDVDYPLYLANGRVPTAPASFTAAPGRRVRLRLLNAGGDTAFRIGIPDTDMTITHTDGYPVAPSLARAVLLGMGERLDAIIDMPDRPLPLIGLAEGKHGLAQLLLQPGTGSAPDLAAAATALSNQPVTMSTALSATEAVKLPTHAPDITHELTLGGPTAGYTWTINGATYDPTHGCVLRT